MNKVETEIIDGIVSGGGSIYVIDLLTDDIQDWVEGHVGLGFQPDEGKLYVEARYINDLVQGMIDAGLEIR